MYVIFSRRHKNKACLVCLSRNSRVKQRWNIIPSQEESESESFSDKRYWDISNKKTHERKKQAQDKVVVDSHSTHMFKKECVHKHIFCMNSIFDVNVFTLLPTDYLTFANNFNLSTEHWTKTARSPRKAKMNSE